LVSCEIFCTFIKLADNLKESFQGTLEGTFLKARPVLETERVQSSENIQKEL